MEMQKVVTQAELNLCMEIRRHVFIEEQFVPEEEEIDSHDRLDDPSVAHFLFTKQGLPIGTMRCLFKPNNVLKIGRVAVIREERGKGWGRQMMELIEAYYPDYDRFVLDAQTHAIPFYLRCGYEVMGDVFLDAGIEHRHMEKQNTPK